MRMQRDRIGFTIVETIVVLAVVGVLLGILVPVMAKSKRVAQQVTCASSLRDLGVALRSYMDQENRGVLPVANGYFDQGKAKPSDFTRIVPLLANHLEVPKPVEVGAGRYEPRAPFVCPHDTEIGPEFGFSYDYFPGALMINYATHGRIEPSLALPVTRLYEAGEYSVLFADIKPWHDHPIDGRMAAFWDGSAGPIKTE